MQYWQKNSVIHYIYIIRIMTRRLFIIFVAMTTAMCAMAQDTQVQNRPYTDLRPFHFGVMVGTHLQDLELTNIGPQMITTDDGTTEKLITADQSNWDAGFTVGVLGETRLGTHFAFRLAPAMYFGTRNIKFMNLTDKTGSGENVTQTQQMKTIYISAAADLIFSAPRHNNYRPYLMAGVNPMLNLSGNGNDYIKLKKYDVFLELGLGCDFYLPFFKLRPELKFCYGLTNCLDTNHAKRFKDTSMADRFMYANSVKEARSKIIALTFYFE